MKKIICFCLLMFMFPLQVHADVLAEPRKDEFYLEHQDEMEYEFRYYQTTTDLQIMESPVSDHVKGTVGPDHIIYVEFTYTDKQEKVWGLQVLNNGKAAWFLMDSLTALKTHDDFINEHPEAVFTLNTPIEFEGDGWLTFWEYPGSLILNSTVEAVWTKSDDYPMSYTHQYTDEEGNLWIYIPYYAAHTGWINTNAELTDEPLVNTTVSRISINETIEPAIEPTPEPPVESDSPIGALDDAVEDDTSNHMLLGGLVIGVCALTGILTIIKNRKKDSK